MKAKSIVLLLLVTCCISQIAVAASDPAIRKFHHPEQLLQSLQHDPHAAKKIYQQFCANCHDPKPLISLGAPRKGVAADWKPRMNQTLQQMLDRINLGLNAMPARGGCFECSDEQLKAAIIYMLPVESK